MTVAVVDPQASEVGPDVGKFTLTRMGGTLASPLTVLYTVGGTATMGSDYQMIGLSATFPPNQTTVSVGIVPLADRPHHAHRRCGH